ncbi:Holliday junction branch migration protein RuvA [Nesterenkonia alkaliphila]|uniref:Holliday junction branch migration complex subunit RuvA n=1 Tax=Nesterenkonia alkaliphila TaxID=1463631 RepID=A0A7K1UM36_9MICC|nr:Holliday junction branch migration protein RuvA [Nesterenkonia alkaliphila]MVT27530.1 Holliday junction branch migration protein RuvA [Nesterenkonia alkaliphila]GFZ80318.1 Holliday junction ATP-dependent DNA helicase RuvA [Nesterenkonia alkaliphila]
MISSIRGEVLHLGLDHAVVEVSGFGLTVQATQQTLSALRTGQPAFLHTSYVPRQDDAPLLFGFSETGEREIFTTLLSISGVGPRLALAVLSVHTPDEVRLAIRDSDTAAFTKVPGIGKKTAQRILLELAGKLVIEPEPAAGEQSTTTPTGAEITAAEVRAALTSLGWTEKDAGKAVDEALAADPELGQADTATVLRTVLRGLGAAKAGAGR